MKKFEDTGVFTNIETPVHNLFARSAENIAIVRESSAEDPNVLIPRRSQELVGSVGLLGIHPEFVTGQASNRNMKKYFFGDFLSADFWQKL